jgi:hypothetical protein
MLREKRELEMGDDPNKTAGGDSLASSQRSTNAKRKKSTAERIGIKGKR